MLDSIDARFTLSTSFRGWSMRWGATLAFVNRNLQEPEFAVTEEKMLAGQF